MLGSRASLTLLAVRKERDAKAGLNHRSQVFEVLADTGISGRGKMKGGSALFCPMTKSRLSGRFSVKGCMVYQCEINIQTGGHKEMQDLTDEVARIVSESKVQHGIAHVFNIGSTGAVGTIEFEPGLRVDLPEMLDKLFPPSRNYGHELAWHDGNGHSHLQATLLGPSLTVPVKDGRLVLGTWQQIFHLECDVKPRQRTIAITVMGEV
jgi:secondary thiamine-phosphate synthase enzyme